MPALINPRTGMPFDTSPDDVLPGDLIVGSPGASMGVPMLGRTDVIKTTPGAAPARLASAAGAIPLVPTPAEPQWGGGSVGNIAAVDPGSPEDDEPPAAPSQPVTVAPKPSGGGGGGGGPVLPAGPTAGQTVAQGRLQIAEDEERDVIRDKQQLEINKANAQAKQDQAEAAAEKELAEKHKQVAAALTADLKAKQDVLAKDKIKDIFEGKPLAGVLAALASGLGAFAAARSGGVNHAQGVLDRAAEMFRQKELHRFEQEEKQVAGATSAIERAEVRADVAMAALYKKFARDREAVLRRFGADDAKVAGDALLQQNSAKAAERESAWQDKAANIARQEVNDRAQRGLMGAQASAARANAEQTRAETEALKAGGPKAGSKPAAEIIQQVAGLDAGLTAIDRTIAQIEKSPKAAQEFLENNESWRRAEAASSNSNMVKQGRGALQLLGAADSAPEEGLKTPGGKEIHKGVQSILTATAKGFGGVITEGDIARATSQLAAVGADPKALAATLKQIRNDWSAKRDLFVKNGGVTLTAGSPAASSAGGGEALPAGAPPGSVRTRVTNPKTGQTMDAWKAPNGRLFVVR